MQAVEIGDRMEGSIFSLEPLPVYTCRFLILLREETPQNVHRGETSGADGYKQGGRLKNTTTGGLQNLTYTYDPNGNILSIIDASSLTPPGPDGALTFAYDAATRKYYFAGAQRVAVRVNATLSYFLADHLGSTSITVSATGTMTAMLRYGAWGERHDWSGTTPTDARYTGQYEEFDLKIYYYGARWYDPALSRWLAPDSVIQDPYSSLDWDRYSYVRNNSINHTDPTGHAICTDDGYCGKSNAIAYWKRTISKLTASYGITFSGDWTLKDQLAALKGTIVVAGTLANYIGLSSNSSFNAVFGNLTFARSSSNPGYWGEYGSGTITFYAKASKWTTLVAHELGHAFNARIANNGGTTPYNTLATDGIWTADGDQIAGIKSGNSVPGTGFTCGNSGDQQCYDQNGTAIPANSYYRSTGRDSGISFHHSNYLTRNEDFANTFANWAVGGFTNDEYGAARSDFMTTNLVEWVDSAMGGY